MMLLILLSDSHTNDCTCTYGSRAAAQLLGLLTIAKGVLPFGVVSSGSNKSQLQ